jgi:hypothetical protein
MSGKIVNNVFRASGVIAATPGGLDWSTAVVTGSTLTATAGKGYFINTTSNTCTVTLPSSAEIGDQIVFADYARTWSTNNVIIDSNGLNFQGDPDTYTVDYSTAGQSLNIVYSDATKGWLPVSDDAVADVGVAPATQKGIFAYGSFSSSHYSLSNIVSSSGVIASDVTGVGTARTYTYAAPYGGDKAIFGGGSINLGTSAGTGVTNLVSNSGVVASDTTAVGTARMGSGAAGYGGDKAIFAFGTPSNYAGSVNTRNLISNTGVKAADVTGAGTARYLTTGASYGGDKAIMAYGYAGGATSQSNLVSNTGVVGSDVSGVGTARYGHASTSYGGDKAIFGFGYGGGSLSLTNLVSNSGVISSDVTGVGTARNAPAASTYGGDKAIFAYGGNGDTGADLNYSNLVSNSGVVASDVTGVGTGRVYLGAAGFSYAA